MVPSFRALLKIFLVTALGCGLLGCTPKIEPNFSIKASDQTRTFTRTDLLNRKDATVLELDNVPEYPGKKMRFHAVPIYALFSEFTFAKDAILQFETMDGFSAPISQERLLNSSQERSVAYLAIEAPDEKWPLTESHGEKKSIGPFYLVWTKPGVSHISEEEWPYQLSAFEVKPSLKISFPNIFPDPNLFEKHPVSRGFKVFVKNCFACHTLNLQGEAKIGPDLNIPLNPTEYFKEKALKVLIRNPQNLRSWPESKMASFPEKVLSDGDINDVIAYLAHMSKRKQTKH